MDCSIIPEFRNARASDILQQMENQESVDFEKKILTVEAEVFEKLFDHQIQGIQFLFDNFKKKHGCILADDMGLGKTVQICTFISSLKFEGYITKAMIIVPATLLDYWEHELARWLP